MTRQRGGCVDIGLLPFDAPITEFVESDFAPGDDTADEAARGDNLEVAVEIADPRFAALS